MRARPTGKPRRGSPRLFLAAGLTTILLSGALGFLLWQMRPLSARGESEQRQVDRIMLQTDLPYRDSYQQLDDIGINGWIIAPPVYPYVVALDLIGMLAGLGLTGYGATRLARERQARQAPPA